MLSCCDTSTLIKVAVRSDNLHGTAPNRSLAGLKPAFHPTQRTQRTNRHCLRFGCCVAVLRQVRLLRLLPILAGESYFSRFVSVTCVKKVRKGLSLCALRSMETRFNCAVPRREAQGRITRPIPCTCYASSRNERVPNSTCHF